MFWKSLVYLDLSFLCVETTITWPDLTWPDLTWPDLAWPDLAWPGLAWTWPDLTWPDLAWPDLTWPDLTCTRQGLGFAAWASLAPKDSFVGGSGRIRPWRHFRGLGSRLGSGTYVFFRVFSFYVSSSHPAYRITCFYVSRGHLAYRITCFYVFRSHPAYWMTCFNVSRGHPAYRITCFYVSRNHPGFYVSRNHPAYRFVCWWGQDGSGPDDHFAGLVAGWGPEHTCFYVFSVFTCRQAIRHWPGPDLTWPDLTWPDLTSPDLTWPVHGRGWGLLRELLLLQKIRLLGGVRTDPALTTILQGATGSPLVWKEVARGLKEGWGLLMWCMLRVPPSWETSRVRARSSTSVMSLIIVHFTLQLTCAGSPAGIPL